MQVIVPVMLGWFLSLYQNGMFMDQTWYEKDGVISATFLLIILNTANDVMKVVNFFPIALRYGLGRLIYSQSKLTNLYRPPTMHIGIQYARTHYQALLRLTPSLSHLLTPAHTFSHLLTPSHTFSPRYGYAIKSAAFGVVYGPIYPPAYLLTTLGLLLSWVCTRFGIRHW